MRGCRIGESEDRGRENKPLFLRLNGFPLVVYLLLFL
jgi:hypothetical protein